VLTLEATAIPLDYVRGASLRTLSKSRLVARVLGRRDTRIATLGSFSVLLLLGLTARWPVAMYFIGPVVLGVVHLAADVRYLAFRLPLPRSLLLASAAFAVAILALGVWSGVSPSAEPLARRLELALGVSWVAFACSARPAFTLAPARMLLSVAVVVALLWPFAPYVELAMTHLHNVAAFALWLWLYRRKAGWALLPVAVTAVGCAVLLSGINQSSFAHHGPSAFGVRASHLAAALAPGLSPRLALGVAATFVFLQSVHYTVWTQWVAQDCLVGEGTPTFRMTLRSLRADFGLVALAVIACVVLGLAVAAYGHMRGSVHWYMLLARSHVWFEGAVAAYFLGARAPFERRP
jgi:hypothetical protein